MKRLVLFIGLSVGFANLAVGQDSEKEWKKKMKEMDPMEFKSKMEELDKLRTEAATKDNEIQELKSKNEKLETEKQDLETKLSAKPAASTNPAGETKDEAMMSLVNERKATIDDKVGVVFKVQIGAFRNKNLEKYFANNPNFGGEKENDGTQRYTIGVFKDYWEADKFKKYMREMGVNDAWIVAYKNGKRVDIKDVLEGVVK